MSGLASAGRSFGIPSIVNLNGGSYNTSTGGILPVILNTAEIHGYNTTGGLYGNDWQGGFIPSRTGVKGRYPQPSGFSSNYTVTQQGFTANISCQAHTNVSAVPSLEVSPSMIASDGLSRSVWFTRCINGGSTGQFGMLRSIPDRSVICVLRLRCRHRFGFSRCCRWSSVSVHEYVKHGRFWPRPIQPWCVSSSI
jgi:hypothetical protein